MQTSISIGVNTGNAGIGVHYGPTYGVNYTHHPVYVPAWHPIHYRRPPIVYHPVYCPIVYAPAYYHPVICQPVIVRPWWTSCTPAWYWPYNGWSVGYHGKKWSFFIGDIWSTGPVYETVYVQQPVVVAQPVVYQGAPVVDSYDYIDRLIDHLKYGDIDTRKDAARELGSTGNFRALYPLVYSVEYDNEPLVRHYAAKSLGKLGFRDALPALRRVANEDSEEVVRAEAQDAIDRILDRNS